jgi:hypothetical protein
MKKILFITSLLLLTGWIAGVFVFKSSAIIHVLLLLSGILFIRSLIQRDAANYLAGHNRQN